jgi:5-methylcytosine-specific restriction endonuclease McrA
MTKKEWKKLDKLIEKFSKEDKDYRCEDCGRSKKQGWQIHHHHFIGRKKTSLRWVNENIFVLCAWCHSQWENDPQMAVRKARNMRGEKWYHLIEKIKVKINKHTFEENKELVDKSLEEVFKSYK